MIQRKARPFLTKDVTALANRGKIRYEGYCSKCRLWRFSLHRDHIIPLWEGGPDLAENLQLICANCHEDKSRTDYVGFKHTLRTKRLIARRKRGQKLSSRHRRKLSRALKGRVKTAEHLEALRRPRSKKGQANIAAANTKLWKSMNKRERSLFALLRWESRRSKQGKL